MSNYHICQADGIYSIIFSDAIHNRTIAQAFFDEYEQLIRAHDLSQPYRILVSTVAVKLKTWTPYMRQRTEGINDLLMARKISGREAIVIDDSITMRLMRLFVESSMRRKNPLMVRKFFFADADGLAWLHEDLYPPRV